VGPTLAKKALWHAYAYRRTSQRDFFPLFGGGDFNPCSEMAGTPLVPWLSYLQQWVTVLELLTRVRVRDDNSVWVPDLMDMDTGTIFYPRVTPVFDPNRDGYGTGI
jgi:hypothetical protein